MSDLSVEELGIPYASRWMMLKADSHIWGDGPTAQEFIQGALHPALAKDLYCSLSEVLADRAAKSLVWVQCYTMALIDQVLDAGRVIERQSDTNAALRLENLELRVEGVPEAIAMAEEHASALDEEVSCLKTESEESRSHIRTLDDELLTLSHDVETARSSAGAAEEVLKEERLVLPKKIEGAIADGFKHGLVRSRQTTYEFGYRVACARFRARYLDLELDQTRLPTIRRIRMLICR
ncbi:hypothetical protein C4D60_Mb03t13100 [Musa balbisiana]|uniref:Uncharacterized protein n=1 Tax=Musa balbisiana TaxID=52838 RepID=A0A4S8JC02_MUSBA|nr:hypothetical protein C4D60_Mb03t13100 [Musa balbisiana]